jgi:hypothetical protein
LVKQWRTQHAEVVAGWRRCHEALTWIKAGQRGAVDPGKLIWTCAEGLVLPSGRLIRYPSLAQYREGDAKLPEWWYGEGRHRARIYAGKVTENIVQALARDSVFDASIEFYRQTNLRPALRVHDELVYVVPEAQAEGLLEKLQSILRTPPKWWPDLVVWSEGGVGVCYGDVK